MPTPENVGRSLSESIALGDWRLFFQGRDQIRDVTLADVQRVAQAYLLPANRTFGQYLPTDRPARAPAPAKGDSAQALQGFKPQAAAAKVAAFDATPANIDARTQRFQVGGVKAAVLAKPTRGDAVQAVLTLRFGDEKSLFGQSMVGDALARLIDKGSATLSRQQVQDRLDALKTTMSIGGSPSQVNVSLSSRREHLAEAIALAGELLRQPALPADAFDEYRRQMLTRIEAQRKEPAAVAGNAMARLGNPYPRGDVRHARSFDEMVEDLNALTLAQLRGFHQRFYGARDAQFGAAGDIDVAEVRSTRWRRPSATGTPARPTRACRRPWCRPAGAAAADHARQAERRHARAAEHRAERHRRRLPGDEHGQLPARAAAAARGCGSASARPKACPTTCAAASAGTTSRPIPAGRPAPSSRRRTAPRSRPRSARRLRVR